MTTAFRCQACAHWEAKPFLNQCEDLYMGFPGKFDYWRCERCELVQIHPQPHNIGQYYRNYQVHGKKSVLHKIFRELIMSRGYFFPDTNAKPLRILDYGCGDGWFLERVKRLGHEGIGYEPSSEHADQLSESVGCRIFADADLLLEEFAQAFDLVTLHFVLEHVTDLDGTFELLNRLLKPGGALKFIIPNIESRDARLFRRKWHGLDPPRHISFPTKKNAEQLCARHGLEIESISTTALPSDFAGTLSNLLTGKYRYPVFVCGIPAALIWSALVSDCCLRVHCWKK